MADFNAAAPPPNVTNPGGNTDPQYPRHLHKFGGAYVIVRNDTERDLKLAEGWSLRPVTVAPVEDDEPELVASAPRRGRPRAEATA